LLLNFTRQHDLFPQGCGRVLTHLSRVCHLVLHKPQGSLHTSDARMFELETLPLEILFNILSFTASASDPPTLRPHPINSLAATSSHLYSVVEEYTRGLLKQHVGFVPPKSSKKFTCRRKWLAEICQLCKKSSKRRATLYPTLTMCKTCDRKHFPKMVSPRILMHHGSLFVLTQCLDHDQCPYTISHFEVGSFHTQRATSSTPSSCHW
jgi:hypothetical protein